jgi:membrane fusion protein, macrolide-specific efflux system
MSEVGTKSRGAHEAAEPKKRRGSITVKRLGIGAVLLALLGLGGWKLYKKLSHRSRGENRLVEASEGPIEETIDATGSVLPLNRVEIKPPIGGRIDQLIVDEGDKVKVGQILAWMSSTDRAAILDAARAHGPEALKHWQDAYKPTPVMAPLDGVIILKNVVVGQTVDPTVVTYAMSDYLIVIAQVDESDIGRVKIGMPARITLDSYPDKVDDGKVFDILYEGKNVSNVIQYGVKIRLNKTPAYYRSQMSANISFIVRKKEDALLLPAVAVRETAAGTKQVLVPDGDEGPQPRTVTTGIESGDKIEILSGLQEGDQVYLSQGRYVPQQPPASSPLNFTGPTGPGGRGAGAGAGGGGGGGGKR